MSIFAFWTDTISFSALLVETACKVTHSILYQFVNKWMHWVLIRRNAGVPSLLALYQLHLSLSICSLFLRRSIYFRESILNENKQSIPHPQFPNISHSIVLPSTPTVRFRIYSGSIPFNVHACYILRTLKHLWLQRPNNTATLPDRATCRYFTCYTGHLDFRTEATDFLPQSPPNAQRGRARNMQLLFIQKTCNFKLALRQP